MSNRKSTPDDFYARVDKNGPNGCWSWLGSTNRLGYGQLGYQGRRVTAHRLSYELNKGAIPDGQIVRHTCDNPNCCNPDHLLLGTHQDNADDKVARGRKRGPAGSPSINPTFPTVAERELATYGACNEGHTLVPSNQYTKRSGEVVCLCCYYYNRAERRKLQEAAPETEAQRQVVATAKAAIEALISTLPELQRLNAMQQIHEAAQSLFMNYWSHD